MTDKTAALAPLIKHYKLGDRTTAPDTLPCSAYEVLRVMCWSADPFRYDYTCEIGWFLLTTETKEALCHYLKDKKVLEVGSGTGYLAHHLIKGGVADYTAVDKRCDKWWGEGNIFFAGIEGNAVEHVNDTYDVVVMCWPPMGNPYSLEVVTKMSSGQILLYQGEPSGGNCGTDEFWDYVDEHFTYIAEQSDILNEHHVKFPGMRDVWEVYIKD